MNLIIFVVLFFFNAQSEWMSTNNKDEFIGKFEFKEIKETLSVVSEISVPYQLYLDNELIMDNNSMMKSFGLKYPKDYNWGRGYEFKIKFLEKNIHDNLENIQIYSNFDDSWKIHEMAKPYCSNSFLGICVFFLIFFYMRLHQFANLYLAFINIGAFFIIKELFQFPLIANILYPIMGYKASIILSYILPRAFILLCLYLYAKDLNLFPGYFKKYRIYIITYSFALSIIYKTLSFFGLIHFWSTLFDTFFIMLVPILGLGIYIIAINAKNYKDLKLEVQNLELGNAQLMVKKIGLEAQVVQKTQENFFTTRLLEASLSSTTHAIIMCDDQLIITPEYSKMATKIFNKEINVGGNILDFIFENSNATENTIDQSLQALRFSMGNDIFNYEMNKHNIVSTLTYNNGMEAAFDWYPSVNDKDEVVGMMLVIADKKKESQSQELLEESLENKVMMYTQIKELGISKFVSFYESSCQMLDELKLITANNTDGHDSEKMFRLMHTIKGNSRTYNLTRIMETTHLSEEFLDNYRKNKVEWNKDKIVEDIKNIRTILEEYKEIMDTHMDANSDPAIKKDRLLKTLDELYDKFVKNQISAQDFDLELNKSK